MKIKNFFAAALPVLAVAGAVVSCNDYDNGFSEERLAYDKAFSDTFGSFDQSQDWNLAERASVNVTVAQPSTITIYALVNGTYSIVGEYASVEGTQELKFDVLEGTTDLLVTDGITGIYTTVGGDATFAGATAQAKSRGANYGDDVQDKNGNATTISVGTTGNYVSFTRDEATAFATVLPEIDNGTLPYSQSNLERAVKNFKYISNGRFTFRPVYWNTSSINEIGIYYTDATGYHEVPVYTIKSGDELQNVYAAETGKEPENVVNKAHSSVYGYDESPAAINQRSKAITIDIPAGTIFGFYLKNPQYDFSFYSEASKNPRYERYTEHRNENACYAASVIVNGNKYICFEDWYDGDFDLNDVVFKFDGYLPTTIEDDATAASWMIACEDLGGTYDWDFNDVIFKVTHISGREEATITPIAAGGTLASYIFFENPNEPNSVEQCLGEIHQLFSKEGEEEPAVSGQYIPLNVKEGRGTEGYPFNIIVGEDFSLAHYSSDAFNTNGQNAEYNMGGFSVRVLKRGTAAKPRKISVTDPAFGEASIVAAPEMGAAPQMICLPSTYELGDYTYAWAWSLEKKTLSDGNGNGSYPRFAGWVADHKANTDWYKYPNDNPVTTVPEKKWLTPELEPTPAKTTPTIGGGNVTANWGGTYMNISGDFNFLIPSGQSVYMKFQLDGQEYNGTGTFSLSVEDNGTGTTAVVQNGNEFVVTAQGGEAAVAKVIVTFSGDENYYSTYVIYNILVAKEVHFKTHANATDYGLAIKDGKLAAIAPYNKFDANQTWYQVAPIDKKGKLAEAGTFWLYNAGTHDFVEFGNSSYELSLKKNIPVGDKAARFHFGTNGRVWDSYHGSTYVFGLNGFIDGGCTVGLLKDNAENAANIMTYTIE